MLPCHKSIFHCLLSFWLSEICVRKINVLSEYGMIWTDEDGFVLKPLGIISYKSYTLIKKIIFYYFLNFWNVLKWSKVLTLSFVLTYNIHVYSCIKTFSTHAHMHRPLSLLHVHKSLHSFDNCPFISNFLPW